MPPMRRIGGIYIAAPFCRPIKELHKAAAKRTRRFFKNTSCSDFYPLRFKAQSRQAPAISAPPAPRAIPKAFESFLFRPSSESGEEAPEEELTLFLSMPVSLYTAKLLILISPPSAKSLIPLLSGEEKV